MKTKEQKLILILILLLASFLRLWKIGSVPMGVTGDEIGYIYNAYSLAKTAKNVFGESRPFLTWINRQGFPFLPVTTYLIALFFKFFGLSASIGRLPSALLGISDVLIIYLLVKLLFNNNKLALISSLFLAISPWHVFLSRTAYDTNIAFFFYFLGVTLFIWEVRKKRLPILSLVSFWLAIFAYRGMNPVFPALIITLFWFGWRILKMSRKQIIAFSLGILFIISSFLFITQRYLDKGYIAEVSVDKAKMQKDIDSQIREARGPLLIKRSFLNKPIHILKKWQKNYLEGYSIGHLFLWGEFGNIVFIPTQGKFYLLDLLFIIPGLFFLFRKKAAETFLISLLSLAAGLPGMVAGSIYLARNFLLAGFIPIFSAAGFLFMINKISSNKIKTAFIILTSLIYTYLFGSFLFDYYYRFAFHNAENWFKSLKDVSSIIEGNKDKYDKVVVAPSSWGDLLQYSFYAKLEPSFVQKAWQNRTETFFKINHIHFYTECRDQENKDPRGAFLSEKEKILVVLTGDMCFKQATPSAYIKDFYGNTRWRIYE